MSKVLTQNSLRRRSPLRALLAVSLTISLAAIGCTTDRTLGDGDPVTTPGVRSMPTGGTSSGSESAPQNPPMMSSSRFDALPVVRPRRLTPDEAALIMAERAPRVRVLGPAMPGDPGRPYASEGLVTGQWINPAMQTNPQLTVNSSLTSNPSPAIASGAGEGVAGGAGVTSIAGTAGTGSALGTTAVTNAAGAVFAAPAGTAATTPTGAAIALPAGTFAAGTVSPTAASVVNPPTTISATPGLATIASQRTAGIATTRNAVSTATTANNASATTNATTAIGTATGTVVNPVRIIRGSNGRATITNQ